MSEFIIDYDFEGSQWSFSIFAKDMDEAKAKLERIRKTGIIFGRVKSV